MHQYYSKKDAGGQLVEARVTIPWAELMELLAPHIAPDGFMVKEYSNGRSGVDIWFVRATHPTSGDSRG